MNGAILNFLYNKKLRHCFCFTSNLEHKNEFILQKPESKYDSKMQVCDSLHYNLTWNHSIK